jgi:hypothetical protein
VTFVNGNREWLRAFVVVEHANSVERELTLLRAQRANFVFRGTTELPGAFKLSVTHNFTWLRENRKPRDERIFETRYAGQRQNDSDVFKKIIRIDSFEDVG